MTSVIIPNEYLSIENTYADENTWYYGCRKCFDTNGVVNFDNNQGNSFLEYPLIEKDQVFKNGIKHIRLECGKCNTWVGWKEQPPQNFIMPFGKHKGKKLIDIPTDYLEWLEEKNICKDKLKDKISELLDSREN